MLNEEQFIAKLNERLRQHSLYEDSMEFVAMPQAEGRGHVTGIDWRGAKFHRRMFLSIARQVSSDFVLSPVDRFTDRSNDSGSQNYVEGTYVRESDNSLHRYSIRFDAGPSPEWSAQVQAEGGVPYVLSGSLTGNVHGGTALAAAMCAMLEVLIEDGASD